MIRMKLYPILLTIALLLVVQHSFSQKKSKVNRISFCGVRLEKKAFLEEVYQQQFDFLNLQEYDTVVDIGAGSGWYEGALSVASPLQHLNFFLVDISTDCLNATKVNNMKAHYAALKGSPITHTFTIINNTVDSLYLPARTFKKVWIMNTLHEIPDQHKMAQDIYDILQPGGEVVILEMIPRKEHELHGGCNMPLMSREQLDQLFTSHHFTVKDHIDILAKRRSPLRMIRYIRN